MCVHGVVWSFFGWLVGWFLSLSLFFFFFSAKALLFPFGPRLKRRLQSDKKAAEDRREELWGEAATACACCLVIKPCLTLLQPQRS